MNNNRSTIICRFFLSGNCRYDSFCRYAHVLPDNDDPVTNKQAEIKTRNWIDAPEFVPRGLCAKNNEIESNDSHMGIVNGITTVPNGADHYSASYATILLQNTNIQYKTNELCPYLNMMVRSYDGALLCRYGENCTYLHGLICEICGQYCLHPTDENERKKHEKECMAMLEKDMEHNCRLARSKDKTCGICFEIVTEKAKWGEHRFGILPNCNHIFCLSCIRTWRKAKTFDNSITRACPECRVESNYVCPSLFWVDTKDEKESLLKEYKDALNGQHCKYFNRGEGSCPFGNKCFYKHALQSGELIDVGKPQKRQCFDQDLERIIVEDEILWNFLQAREDFEDETLSSIFSSD